MYETILIPFLKFQRRRIMTVYNLCFLNHFIVRCIAIVFLVVICMFASTELYGQPPNKNDFKISPQVQKLVADTQLCLNDNDLDCARSLLTKFPMSGLSELEQYRYWLLMGRVVFFEGNYPEAIKVFRKIADLAPDPGPRKDYMRYIAQLYASMGQFQQAYDTLEELMVEDGLVPLGRRHLTHDALSRGLEIYATGNWPFEQYVTKLPEFPTEATTFGLQSGYVDLEFTVTKNGVTRDIQVIGSSNSVFEESAIKSAEKFMYIPRLLDGKPVETVTKYRIEFKTGSSE